MQITINHQINHQSIANFVQIPYEPSLPNATVARCPWLLRRWKLQRPPAAPLAVQAGPAAPEVSNNFKEQQLCKMILGYAKWCCRCCVWKNSWMFGVVTLMAANDRTRHEKCVFRMEITCSQSHYSKSEVSLTVWTIFPFSALNLHRHAISQAWPVPAAAGAGSSGGGGGIVPLCPSKAFVDLRFDQNWDATRVSPELESVILMISIQWTRSRRSKRRSRIIKIMIKGRII